jgi:acyl-CoA synthetase (AMP-forming)/AMP-acid ligase II
VNIATFLHSTAHCYPGAPAISVGDVLTWTYAGLQNRVVRLAGGLRASPGVKPGDRIAMAMKNCPEYFELMWAAWHAGLIIVPMNAKLHAKEFAFILQNCGVRYCFVTPELSHALAAEVGSAAEATRIVEVGGAEFAAMAAHDALPLQVVHAEDPAWLFYTSGTTGRPKGATLTHRSLVGMTLRYYADVDAVGQSDCMIHTGPLSHASGLYSVPHFAKGSHQVIPASQGFDPVELFGLFDYYRETTFFCAPTMVTRLLHEPGVRSARLDSIKTLFYGGAPMYLENLKSALNLFGPRLWQGYGQGETPNTISCLSKAMHADDGHPRFEERLASVGIARTGVEVRVVDESGSELPAGEVGEIICRSEVTMSGYWNNPQATASALRDQWLHTGDLGVFDEDRFLTLKDRSNDVIISGGSNIYPREVEEVLLQHPDVLEASVIGRPHDDWGEEVVAFVVPKAGRVLDEAMLDRLCLDNIARFKRPKHYVRLDELPKSSYGKILKSELRTRLQGIADPRIDVCATAPPSAS